jgi:RHS repeat-associated protein
VADATGTTVWRWDQAEPFGNNPADENPSGLGAFDLPLRLPGQVNDKETGLFHNGRRDYDPAIGGYSQADPLGIVPYQIPARRLNHPYVYADSDPLSNVDPLGLCPCAGGVWDQEIGDFQYNVAAGGYLANGNVNFTCRSDPSLKCSGKQLSIGAGTPNASFSWALGGVQFGASDSSDLSGWSGSGVFSGWNLGLQGGIFQGQISLSGQGGGTAIGLPRGFSAALFKSLNYQMKCSCQSCPPQ